MLASLLVLLASVAAVSCANADEPHFHQGEMAPYEIGPPSTKLATSRRRSSKARRHAGHCAERRRVASAAHGQGHQHHVTLFLGASSISRHTHGWSRASTVLKIYESSTNKTGVQTTKAKYDIHALHLKFTCESPDGAPSPCRFVRSCTPPRVPPCTRRAKGR